MSGKATSITGPSTDAERIRELETDNQGLVLIKQAAMFEKNEWKARAEKAEARVAELEAARSCIPCADSRHLQCTGGYCECPSCYPEPAPAIEGHEREEC